MDQDTRQPPQSDDAVAEQRGTDRALDEHIVRRLIDTQFSKYFTSAGLEQLKPLGSGWDNDAYLVPGMDDRVWVFRFPRRAEVVGQLAREQHWLPLIAATLSAVTGGRRANLIAVPNIELHGSPGASYPYPFAAYQLLTGIAVAALEPAISEDRLVRIARQLGPALKQLHGLTEESLTGARGLAFDNDVGTAAGWYDYVATNRGRLLASLPSELAQRCADHLDEQVMPDPFAETPRLLHNDLGSEHVLVDGDTLTGIIDFGDLDIGDPAVELANTAAWLGAEGFAVLLTSYSTLR